MNSFARGISARLSVPFCRLSLEKLLKRVLLSTGKLLSKKEDTVCNSARGTKKVRGICWVLAVMQSKGVMEMMVDVVSCNILHRENSGFF